MNKLAFCFHILLINSFSSKEKKVTYTFNLKTEKIAYSSSGGTEYEYSMNLKIYKPGMIYGKNQIYDESIAITEDIFKKNKIKLNVKCFGCAIYPVKQISLEKENSTKSKKINPTIAYESYASSNNVECFFPDSSESNMIIYMQLPSKTDESDPKTGELTLDVILDRRNKFQYEFELLLKNQAHDVRTKKRNYNHHEIDLNIKEKGIDKPMPNIYEGKIKTDYKDTDRIKINFECPGGEINYHLTFKKNKKAKYEINEVTFPKHYKYGKHVINNKLVLCGSYGDKKFFKQLDMIQDSAGNSLMPGSLELSVNMVKLGNPIYNFELKKSANENEIELEMKDIIDKQEDNTYSGNIKIDNHDLKNVDTVNIYFECPERELTYYLTFKKNEQNNYKIGHIYYVKRYLGYRDFISTKNVQCDSYGDKKFFNELDMIQDSAGKSLELNVNMVKLDNPIYNFELKKSANENGIELEMKERRFDKKNDNTYSGNIKIDNHDPNYMDTVNIHFECPEIELTYYLTFRKNEQNNYQIDHIYYVKRYMVDHKYLKRSIVLCGSYGDKKFFNELDMIQNSTANSLKPESLELSVKMVKLDNYIYNFELNKSANENKIGLKMKERRLDKQKDNSYSGKMKIDNHDLKYMDTVNIYFKCPGRKVVFKLTFKKNEQNDYQIDDISFIKHYMVDPKYLKRSIVLCDAYGDEKAVKKLLISDIYFEPNSSTPPSKIKQLFFKLNLDIEDEKKKSQETLTLRKVI